MTTTSPIRVTFLHPRESREFTAEINGTTTGQQALDGLVKARFIEAAGRDRAYALQHARTSRSIPLSGSLVSAGVADGDTVAVTETSAGARS